MKILVATHYFADHGGGVEIVAEQLAVRFAELGHRVDWIAAGPLTQSTRGESPADGVTRHPILSWNVVERLTGLPCPLWNPFGVIPLWRLVRSADVVHIHDCLYPSNVLAAVFCRLLRVPYVMTQHIGEIPFSSAVMRTILGVANGICGRIALSGAAQVGFCSHVVRDYFDRFLRLGDRGLVVPNGLDGARFHAVNPEERAEKKRSRGWSTNRMAVLFVGRFVEKKGLPFLRRLAEATPQVDWKFVGWGPMNPNEWGLSNVEVVGKLPQSDIVDCYHAADLFVLPSFGEGFPLVVQEALACGLPCVITDETAAALPEVRDVVEALPFDINGWIAAMEQRLSESSAARDDRRRRCAEFALRWNWDETAGRYLELLNAASNSAKGRRR